MKAQEFENLKLRVEKHNREADRAQGTVDSLMQKLSDDFGCDSVEDAEALLKKTKRQAARKKEELDAALEKFNEDFPNVTD